VLLTQRLTQRSLHVSFFGLTLALCASSRRDTMGACCCAPVQQCCSAMCAPLGCYCCDNEVESGKTMSLDELEKVSKTGDILLFNESGCACFQACLARSSWVHVGDLRSAVFL
jgi:hypothetical protein